MHGAKMAAERQDALREFVAVTGTEEDRARFFLESAGWDLQVAPRGGPLRAGWGTRSAASALRPLRSRSAQSSLRGWALPGPGLMVSGVACHASPAWLGSSRTRAGPGLLCRASVFLRARNGGETLDAAAVRVESSPGGVAAAASACGWPGGFECPASRWSPTEVAVAFRFRFCNDAVLVGKTLQGTSPRPTLT